MYLSFQGIQKTLLKGGHYLRSTKPNPTMNNDGVPVTTSSEIQSSDQVSTPAATSKAVRPNRPPPTRPTGLTKATIEPPGPINRQIPQTISNSTHNELLESDSSQLL